MDMRAPTIYSAEDFRLRALNERPPHGDADCGDHALNPDLRHLILRDNLRDAAVLIAVVDRGPKSAVILTQRTAKLRTHSGQIAFPGGRIDPTDASPEAAALRESEEEIGLDPASVEIVGRMPDYVSGSGFRIAPVLGIVPEKHALKLNPDEVDDAFEVPLGFLMNAANHRRESRIWQEKERFFYTMPFADRYIWGVTAGIIRTLHDRLYA